MGLLKEALLTQRQLHQETQDNICQTPQSPIPEVQFQTQCTSTEISLLLGTVCCSLTFGAYPRASDNLLSFLRLPSLLASKTHAPPPLIRFKCLIQRGKYITITPLYTISTTSSIMLHETSSGW